MNSALNKSIVNKSALNNAALNLVNVTLEYPDGDGTLKALDCVNLTVQAGEFVSLIGPSGYG